MQSKTVENWPITVENSRALWKTSGRSRWPAGIRAKARPGSIINP